MSGYDALITYILGLLAVNSCNEKAINSSKQVAATVAMHQRNSNDQIADNTRDIDPVEISLGYAR
jgi:hypothetical protein